MATSEWMLFGIPLFWIGIAIAIAIASVVAAIYSDFIVNLFKRLVTGAIVYAIILALLLMVGHFPSYNIALVGFACEETLFGIVYFLQNR